MREYSQEGNLKSERLENGLKIQYEYDRKLSHCYENDALNRQTSVDGCPQVHNALHQITTAAHGDYEFDAKGRRIRDTAILYNYDKFDRLISVQQGDAIWEYSYDAFNRKITRTFDGNTIHYLYNPKNGD